MRDLIVLGVVSTLALAFSMGWLPSVHFPWHRMH